MSRDIAAGKRRPEIIELSLARLPLYDELDAIKIDVTNISPADAATRIKNCLKACE
ncbi:hypothetical protein [Nucisporomicrobium flavum]|uniref:hypothetical protein n=1 Tax=Nucisporomicrobium flavum TaxID=2785915 RepID=UPI0018F402CE|nr:hypothetical protein [Nucisporomicrobium flavum]